MATKTQKKPTAKTSTQVSVLDEKSLKDKTYKYTVDKGVQITGNRTSIHDLQFPFPMMNVGDSFLVPIKDPITKSPNKLHYAAKIYARFKPGFTITSRLQLDGCRRVWRIK
jgi:hypothetical protein